MSEETHEVEEKAGAVLSKATFKDVTAIKEACDRILSRSGKTEEEPEKEVDIEAIVEKTVNEALKKFFTKTEPEKPEEVVKKISLKEYLELKQNKEVS